MRDPCFVYIGLNYRKYIITVTKNLKKVILPKFSHTNLQKDKNLI